MKKIFTTYYLLQVLLLMVVQTTVFAQNLIPNPSFELANCPTGYNGFPSQVELYIQNWYSANCASPDPMTNCSTNANTSVPDVWFGSQNARTGTNYMGVGFYGGWYEYIGTRLTQPLIAGSTYNVSFYVSCGDAARYASDAVGIYFSQTQIKCASGFSGPVLPYTPQVVQTAGAFLTNRTGWTKISGTYTATGGEEYIVIGCFKAWNTSGLYDFGSGDTRCYYYIDDISVEAAISLPVELVSSIGKATENNKIELAWETASELNACYYNIERSMDGVNYRSIQRIEANGTTSVLSKYNYTDEQPLSGISYYRLKQVDCDSSCSYSKIISIKTGKLEFTINPNPVHDRLNITLKDDILFPVTIQLYDVLGKIVYKAEWVNKNNISISFSDLSNGTYTVVISSDKTDAIYKTILKQ